MLSLMPALGGLLTIEHAQAAGCPIVVAINKIDLPEADSSKARQRLTEHNLVPEDFGG
ncbi:MAG: hypothetical protein F6K10_40090, partial [Moorea sp. SIO2B7]|nr:hypothetical protein [Moorena sp. SIO2B7]